MPQNSTEITPRESRRSKTPRLILPNIFAFAPNRETLGATAYLIVDKTHNVLIDCPLWEDSQRDFIAAKGGVRQLIITHRGSIGKDIKRIQSDLDCQIIIQEQEAYLLPEVKVTAFQDNLTINEKFELIWTPGHSPGSSCVYWQEQGGVLFTGRHLLPKLVTTEEGTKTVEIAPIQTAKTFHWWRQLKSVRKLGDRFSDVNLEYLIPGANTGYLRGQGYIDNAREKLASVNQK